MRGEDDKQGCTCHGDLETLGAILQTLVLLELLPR